ncbi:ArsR/SmtB family transcription factor [Thermococcus prieurii]
MGSLEYETIDVTDERVRELAQVLANERAMAILRLLRERELSMSEIAKELDMPISTVSYHLDKLLRVGLVEVAGKKYGKRLQEVKLYRASSRPILLLPRPTERRTSPLDKLRVITLSVATGLSALVYWAAEKMLSSERSSGTETIKMFSAETTSRAGHSGDYVPALLAIMTFVIAISAGWLLKKRF